jgi:hypothetical protein
MKSPFLVNTLWSLASLPGARAFDRDLTRVETIQRGYLKSLLYRNRDTGYGRKYRFQDAHTPARFQELVPMVDYSGIEPWIRQAALGESALTDSPTLLLEPTGGTSGGTKFIPYNAALRREFRKGIAPWIRNVFRHYPEVKSGTAYWSVSPPITREAPFECRMPVGFEKDSDYLGPLGRWMESQVFSVPAAPDSHPGKFLDHVARHLLQDPDLAFISIWNPSFLAILLERMAENRESILRDIHDGGSPDRARFVSAALMRADAGESPWPRIWPRLAVISCWRDGWAKPASESLQALFPGVFLQAKGLLATEAFVSLPYMASRTSLSHLLAYTSHFFEFRDVESGRIRFSWEVKAGGTYSVLVTTGGGLYRYQLRDLVRIEGWTASCPRLRFIAKEDSFSDMTGEKLQADFVQACSETAMRKAGIASTFYFLAPEPGGTPPYYSFHVRMDPTEHAIRMVGDRLEKALEENFQYRLSRQLGQLGPVRISPLAAGAEADYYYYKNRRARLGDIKWKPLETAGPWADILRLKRERP